MADARSVLVKIVFLHISHSRMLILDTKLGIYKLLAREYCEVSTEHKADRTGYRKKHYTGASEYFHTQEYTRDRAIDTSAEYGNHAYRSRKFNRQSQSPTKGTTESRSDDKCRKYGTTLISRLKSDRRKDDL